MVPSCRGVTHSDLRPENFLVYDTAPGCLDLLLYDFDGAVCNELRLDGNQLLNDPTQGFETAPALDVFSLGSLFYTVLTVFWSYQVRAS